MDKIKEIYQHNGTDWGDAIPIGVDAENVDVTDGSETTGLDVVLENIHDDILNSSDIGQENADLIGADLTNTLSVSSLYFDGGTIKYDKIGDMVIVYVNGTISANISGRTRIGELLPAEYRPLADERNEVRTSSTVILIVGTDGKIYLSPETISIPSGTEIKGEVAYFV